MNKTKIQDSGKKKDLFTSSFVLHHVLQMIITHVTNSFLCMLLTVNCQYDFVFSSSHSAVARALPPVSTGCDLLGTGRLY